MTRRLRDSVVFWAMLACAALLPGQSSGPPGSRDPRGFEAFYAGHRVMLGPGWLFSPDDNAAYASAAYDDSAWRTVSADRPLSSYGIHDIRCAWYRMHVHLPRGARYLAMEIQNVQGSYELYANGARIGGRGGMDGMLEFGQSALATYDLPDGVIAPDGQVVIALRFGLSKALEGGNSTGTPIQASSVFIASRDAAPRDASYEMAHENAIQFMICGINLLVGGVALALFLAMRSQAEYLAIAISLLAASLQAAILIWIHFHGMTVTADCLEQLALGIVNVALIEFVRLILHLKRTRWLLALEIANFLGYFTVPLLNVGLISTTTTLVFYFSPALTAKIVLLVLLGRGLARGDRDVRVILPAIAVVSFGDFWYFLQLLEARVGLPFHVPPLPSVRLGSYSFDFWSVWDMIYCVTLLLFLVLRTVRITHERARIAGELEAARTVQHVLIPEEIPNVRGFTLKSVYKPAGEVGGDFFQIVPTGNGGVLAVIGDVSGKGMPAAMTVSLLVGTFRTLAHYTQSPGEILAAMNTRMLGRSQGGFTTCLVLRADADGTLTMANAGHISPCVGGRELALENALPLGLSADAAYAESVFHLAAGEQLTLLTDGVIEARDGAGALFGFERAAALSSEPAEAIARSAQEFGQDDDITVLTLSYAGVAASA